jgi:hypothetical protein
MVAADLAMNIPKLMEKGSAKFMTGTDAGREFCVLENSRFYYTNFVGYVVDPSLDRQTTTFCPSTVR